MLQQRNDNNDLKQGIGKYMVCKELGKGAYASVKLVIMKSNKEKYAMKIYDRYKLLDQHKKKAVHNEILVMKKVNHKNIVKLNEIIYSQKQVNLNIIFFKNFIIIIIDSNNNGICSRTIFKGAL